MKTVTQAIWRLSMIAVLLACITLPATADDRWYTVEVLVFAHNQDHSYGAAIRQNYTPQMTSAVHLDGTDNDRVPNVRDSWLAQGAWQTLDEESRVLRHMYSRMRGTGEYTLLFHEAWKQPINAADDMPAVRIDGLAHTGSGELAGLLTFSRSRFLHVDARLWLTPEVRTTDDFSHDYDQDKPAPTYGRMVIEEQRRIRRDNVVYFDHPAFGMLVRITE